MLPRSLPARLSARALATSAPRRCIYDNVSQLIGRTPVVRVNRMAPEGASLYAKLEYFNPLGSVKDRMAMGIIENAERQGHLQPGGTIIEATSGNTGIALAMLCAQRGYRFVCTMAASFSVERRKIIRMLGGKVVITPASQGGTGMVNKAKELAKAHDWYLARQFETMANPEYHAQTTAAEILKDFARLDLDYFVTGYGTGGTFAGVAKVLKVARPQIKVVLTEPAAAPLVSSGETQARKADGSPASGHAHWTPHPIQGWTPNFIPYVAQTGLDANLADEVLTVKSAEAIRTAQELARREGIFCGISGGATVRSALDICERSSGATVLAMIPDTAERYISTPLFAAIEADMDKQELEWSLSTPSNQLEES